MKFLTLSDFLGDCNLAFDAFLHSVGALCTGEGSKCMKKKSMNKCALLLADLRCALKYSTVISILLLVPFCFYFYGQNFITGGFLLMLETKVNPK